MKLTPIKSIVASALVTVAGLAACAEDAPKESVAADTVVYGTIRTAEAGNPVAEAIAIKDGKYVYVGNEAGAAAFIADGVTKVVDHRGKGMVMPGCTDGHSHYLNTFAMGNMKGGILFDTKDDTTNVLRKLDAAARKAKADGKKSLCGFGWNLAVLNKDRPALTNLDEVTHGVSTVIFDSSGHHAFCNSECLKRCGIIDGKGKVLITKIDGGLLELDKDGYPTGYLNERVTGYLTRMGGIDADELIDDEVAEDAIRKSQEFLLSTGYTSALDAWSNNLHPSKFYAAAHRLDTNDVLKLALSMTYEVEPWQTNMTSEINYLDSLNETYRTRHVRPEYLKVFMDGVVESRTGAIAKLYKDGTVYKSFWSTNRLADITKMCNARGLTVHTHAMGDAAIRDTVDAYIQGGNGTQRNCLVHLRNVSTNQVNDFQRIAENNIACAVGLTWHAGDEAQNEFLSGFLDDEYVYHAYPLKSFFDAGVKASGHSDYPANKPCPQDPFGMMHVAVNGMLPIPDEGDEPFDPDELITIEQAFQALTLNGAWQLGLENERGSIAVGKWADFVLADQDVFTCEKTDIGKTKVVETWFEGELVYPAKPKPEPEQFEGGTVTYPKADASTGLVKGSSATWKAKAYAGCVFAGWVWTNGTPAASFNLLSENERKNPSLKVKIAEGEQVRPTDVAATWAWLDEDRIQSVELTPSNLAVVCRSYAKATVSGLPSGLKFNKKTLAITGEAKKDETKTVKVTVKNASGYTWKQSFSVTVANGAVTAIVPADDAVLTGEPVVLVYDGEFGKVKGSKVYVAGRKASLRATPAKGSVFLGWYEDAAFANAATNLPKGYLTASQSVEVPAEGLRLYARFVELGAWTVGTFDGVCYGDAECTNACGTVQLTVSSKGKVSGKANVGGKSYSFKANAIDGTREVEGKTVFVAHPTVKADGETKTFEVVIGESELGGLGCAALLGVEGSPAFAMAVQNGWKLPKGDLRALPAFPTGKDAIEVNVTNGVDLTLKFGAKGTVKAAGMVGEEKISAKSQVLPLELTSEKNPLAYRAQVCVYAPKAGFCEVYEFVLTVGADGKFDAVLPATAVPSDIHAPVTVQSGRAPSLP